MNNYEPPAEMVTSLPIAEAITTSARETPKAEESSIPAKGGYYPCPEDTLTLALGLGVAFIASRRISA